jgi:succinate dehydrogenase / fumarate reductase cytochrome b subunit
MHHAYFGEAIPLTLTVYALGMLGISYHLANGLYTAGIRWGLAISPSGRRRLQIFSAAAFVVLLGMAYTAIYGFYAAH